MSPPIRAALRLILVTGQRPGEVLGARWSEINGDTWIIPEGRSKNETLNRVPLTGLAREILDSLGTDDGEFLFPSRGRSGHLESTALPHAVKRNQEALCNTQDPDWGNWRPHDLRRTVRTQLASLEVPQHIAERVLNHKQQGISAVYDVHGYDREKRQALEKWERKLLRLIGRGEGADVVTLRT